MNSDELLLEFKDYKPEFIISPIIYKRGINILAAERGTGKTRLSIFLAYSVIHELEMLGYQCERGGNILFLNFEMDNANFKIVLEPINQYFKNLNLEKKHELHILTILPEHNSGSFEIQKEIMRVRPSLIIIDGFKAYSSIFMKEHKIREINNSNIIEMIKNFRLWQSLCDSSILLTNHLNKGTNYARSTSDLMYGPGALIDFVDQTFLLRKTDEPNQRIIKPDKSRFANEEKHSTNLLKIESNIDSSELWFELIEKDIEESTFMVSDRPKRHSEATKQNARDLFNQGLTLADIAERTLGSRNKKGTISKWVNK